MFTWNIATRENFDFVKNDPENTDLQGKNRVFLGILSRLQFFTSCYIMNRTGRSPWGRTRSRVWTEEITDPSNTCEGIEIADLKLK